MQEVVALPPVSEESKQPQASLHGPAFPCYIYDTYLCLQRSWFSAFLMLRSWKVIVKAEVQDYNVYDLCSFFWCILLKECQYQDVTYINIACRWAWMLFQKTTWLNFTLCRKLWLFPLFPKRASSRRPACMGPPFHVTFMIHIYAFNFHGSQRSSCWDPGRWLSRQKSKITMSMIYVLSFDVYCIKSANIKMLHISTSLVAELECFSKKTTWLNSTLSRQLWLLQPFPKRASSHRPACMGPPFHVTFMIRIYVFNFHGSQRSSCWDPGRWLSRQKSSTRLARKISNLHVWHDRVTFWQVKRGRSQDTQGVRKARAHRKYCCAMLCCQDMSRTFRNHESFCTCCSFWAERVNRIISVHIAVRMSGQMGLRDGFLTVSCTETVQSPRISLFLDCVQRLFTTLVIFSTGHPPFSCPCKFDLDLCLDFERGRVVHWSVRSEQARNAPSGPESNRGSRMARFFCDVKMEFEALVNHLCRDGKIGPDTVATLGLTLHAGIHLLWRQSLRIAPTLQSDSESLESLFSDEDTDIQMSFVPIPRGTDWSRFWGHHTCESASSATSSVSSAWRRRALEIYGPCSMI